MRASPLLAATLAIALGGGAVHAEPALELLRERARAALQYDDYDAAIALYREIAGRSPEDAEAHYDLAGVLGFVQRNDEAVAPMRRALELRPQETHYHAAAALIFTNAGLHEEAFAANTAAARLGDITAMYELVWQYAQGRGVVYDPERAVTWAIRAAEHGHVGAMSLLVEVYLNGRFGQPVDLAQAERWALRAHAAQQ